ncbi:MAG TPA: DUF362 domain-containing protein [bacterium]|mgnify:CR=1 FL=1|nr:DUF362 domain-containing protein [bacterium]HPN44082.1 DUF362 domain-containing protein [bacterium]
MKKLEIDSKIKNQVFAVRCRDYSQLSQQVNTLLELAGGLEQYIKPGEKIVLKPNLLMAAAPEKCATTHPELLSAIGTHVRQLGGQAILAESPGAGFPHSKRTFERVFDKCGMLDAVRKAGIEASFDEGWQVVSYPEGQFIKRFEVINPILAADGVINLCKLKTHGFMSMTGAVKNCFGVIPGLTKPGYHAKLQKKELFARMLLDLCNYVSPRLSIMDAVIGMEGEGPNAGTPRAVGLLLAAANPLALDVVASEIMGLNRRDNPVLLEAEKLGMTPTRLEDVELIGLDKADLRIAGYKLPSTIIQESGSSRLLAMLAPAIKSGLTMHPHIIEDKCTACGTCRDACPMHVIIIQNKVAVIDDKGCIRCYCCHEMCPHEAIDLQGGFMYRVLNRG